MEDSKALPPIGSGGGKLVPRLSVEQFLYSLARTPTPTRFHRRRERLFKQRSRVSQEINNSQDGGHSEVCDITPAQHHRATRDMSVMYEHQPDIEKCQHISRDELDPPVPHNAGHLALSVPFDQPAGVVDKVQVDNLPAKIDSNDAIIHNSVVSDELLQHKKHDQHHNSGYGNPMFVRANTIDEIERSESIGSARLDQRMDDTITPDNPICSDLEVLPRQPLSEKENSTHEVQGNTETHIISDIMKSAPEPKKPIKTYGNGKTLDFKESNKTRRIPRMLPVEELQITVDRVPPNSIYDPESETLDCCVDPVESISSFLDQELGRIPKQRQVANKAKKRKPLTKIQQAIVRPKADDLCKYMLPNNGDMSPRTRKRSRISMTCSDGFEGREGLPTGRTMPVRLPRRHTQIACQAMVYLPELILVSSRDCTENITDLPRLQNEGVHFREITECSNFECGMVIEGSASMVEELPEPPPNSSILIVQPGYPQSGILNSLVSPVLSCNDHVKHMEDIVPATTCRPGRRVTFSDNIDVIQTFRMISAPIIIKSGPDSVSSESSATDDEETSAEDENENEEHDYRDSSGSSDVAESERDDDKSMEDGMCDDYKTDRFDAHHRFPSASLQPTFSNTRRVKFCDNDKNQSLQRLGSKEQLRGKWADGIDQHVRSRDIPETQQSKMRGDISTTDKIRLQDTAAGKDCWRPTIPITSGRLMRVDNDIMEYPIFPDPVIRQYSENVQLGKESQASVELGDPNWRVLYENGYKQSCSQEGDQDSPQEELRCYISAEQPVYLAQALERSNNASQRDFVFTRSKSATAEQRQQDECLAGSATINPIFRSTASPQTRHLSKA